jgi:hypothetical protein
MEGRIEGRMVSMEGRMVSMEDRMVSMEARLRAYVDQRCERVETALLTEFHKWASPVETKLRSHSAVLRSVDVDLEALAHRVNKLEIQDPGQSH